MAPFVAWLRAQAGNVIVLADGSGAREAATWSTGIWPGSSAYDHHARTGLEVAAGAGLAAPGQPRFV